MVGKKRKRRKREKRRGRRVAAQRGKVGARVGGDAPSGWLYRGASRGGVAWQWRKATARLRG